MNDPSSPVSAAGQASWSDAPLLDAFRRLDRAAAERASQLAADSAWEALLQAGIPEALVLETACTASGAVPADLAGVGPAEADLLSASIAARYGVAPVRVHEGVLEIACANPMRPNLEQDLAFASGHRVRLVVASPSRIRAARAAIYESQAHHDSPRMTDPVGTGEVVSGGAVEMLDRIIAEALAQRASDIHIEPKASGLLVRFRIDGVLQDVLRVPQEIAAPLVSRLKVTAGLDIADRIRPQDGRATTTFEGRSIDLRVSTLPLGGKSEKVVLRVLDAESSTTDLEALGFTPAELHTFRKMLALTEGMILLTGPTGSGKTTTLYSALRSVQSSEKNVVTVEDPIEYRLDGINQVQVNEKAGLTFAAALRSILRQDPDVVLVGEIRDSETAAIAIKASMTGHTVLSTLHTNDAPSAVSRLTDIGVDLGALSGALKGVVAQRLVRRLCPQCSEPVTLAELPADQQMLLQGKKTGHLRKAVGCSECRGTGFRGRMVVAEILVVTPEMQRAIVRGASGSEITDLARNGGMLSLWESGIERVLAGSTSLHELLDNVAAPITDAGNSQSDVDALLAQLLNPDGASPSPAPAPTPVPPPRAPAATRVGDGSGTRVLVVEEDRTTRMALRTRLEEEGVRVIEAADGEAGLAYARRLRPDLVITALVMPRLDGIGLLQGLVDVPGAPPVVVWTTQSDAALLDWARELGAREAHPKHAAAGSLLACLGGKQPSAV